MVLNGFLTTQGMPPHVLFDPHRPSESIANLLDFIAREHLHTKMATIVYVKPAVTYVKDLVKLGRNRGLLQKFNSTELSDRLTDTVNLEVSARRVDSFTKNLQIRHVLAKLLSFSRLLSQYWKCTGHIVLHRNHHSAINTYCVRWIHTIQKINRVWLASKPALPSLVVWQPPGLLATKAEHHSGPYSVSYPSHTIARYESKGLNLGLLRIFIRFFHVCFLL